MAAQVYDPKNPPGTSQASRIYVLPNLMTAGNLFCGFVAIIRCIQARYATGDTTPQHLYSEAVWLIIAAVVFDSLDGRLARLGGRESLFGREFDSIADIVSFGVAPALLVFFLILSPELNPWFKQIGWFVGFIYLLCAAMRLARFNVITHPLVYSNNAKFNTKDFVGLPVPAAAGMVVSLVLILNSDADIRHWGLGLPPLMLLIAYLMISTIRYPSFKQVSWHTRARFGTFIGILAAAAAIFFTRQYALALIFLAYLGYGLGRHFVTVSRRRQRLRDLLEQRHGVRPAGDVNKPDNNT